MLTKLQIPKTILWLISLFLVLLILFTGFRLITFFAFRPPDESFLESLPAFSLGLRYDLKWIAIVLAPVVVLSIRRSFSPFYSVTNQKFWIWYMGAVFFIIFFFFIADLVSFSYNETRLDAGAMNFVEDPGISANMLWQTYPLVWIILGLLTVILLFKWLLNKSHWSVIKLTDGRSILHRKSPFLVMTLLLAAMIYGSFGKRPLQWKDSLALKESFKSYLALNPLQNFFYTMRLRKPVLNEKQAREVFPVMAEFLRLPSDKNFQFRREVVPAKTEGVSAPVNVVLVVCESFSMYKSTMGRNKLNTTPFFDSLTKQGIFFEKCFSPHFSTARGLFAIITGIPDVQMFRFSTRNPAALNQYTIVNNLEGYSRHYFLGGNPEFNNFKGLLENIDQLQIHNENTIPAPKLNVWGISDKDLFLAANDVFRKEKRPFFSIIQTSDNHRPYTIPETDTDFEVKTISREELIQNGFESLEEYNTFRYSDYCFRKFMEAAKKEPYFDNTLFVFVGDHGVAGNATAMYPPAWTSQRLTDVHIPLLFFAPRYLAPDLRQEVVSQIDVLPTVAGILRVRYSNRTLGRDLLDPRKRQDLAFVTNTAGKIGVITNDFYSTENLDFADKEIVSTGKGKNGLSQHQLDSIQTSLSRFTHAFYQTALYLIMNNKK